MHFEIDRKELAKAISAVASVVEKKGTLTVYKNAKCKMSSLSE